MLDETDTETSNISAQERVQKNIIPNLWKH